MAMQIEEALKIVKREIPHKPRTIYSQLVKEAMLTVCESAAVKSEYQARLYEVEMLKAKILPQIPKADVMKEIDALKVTTIDDGTGKRELINKADLLAMYERLGEMESEG